VLFRSTLKFMVVLLLPTLFDLPLLPATSVAGPIPEVAVQTATQQPIPVSPVAQVGVRPNRAIEPPRCRAILSLLWIVGVGWSLVRLLVAWHGARQLRRQSVVIDNMPLNEQLAIQAGLYGLRTTPALLETEGDDSPMLIGILRLAIVIPRGVLRRLSPPELAMVLGHELAHIRHGDLLWSLAAAAVRAIFFFHPLVWLSQRRLNLAQEVAADELAILRQHHDPVGYGRLLVSVIGKIGPGRLIPTLSMGTAGSVQSVTRRLVAMSMIGCASRRVIITSGALLAAMVLLGIVPWRLVAAEPKLSENKKEPPKVALPVYRIEPPDIIEIKMPRVVPLPSYRAAVKSVSGHYMVGPDGKINLRQYGVVSISGKTVAEARIVVRNHLKQYLDSPALSVKVVACNSKACYVIINRGTGQGESVFRLPATGEERVSDVIRQVKGLSQHSSKKIWIHRSEPLRPGDPQILSVKWDALTQGVQPATNYQILPGDRVFFEKDLSQRGKQPTNCSPTLIQGEG
jgi:beta-lactamase regulating signal transducer with metallopeptidase domain/protein involved in polysaccharide export with SLBB domain